MSEDSDTIPSEQNENTTGNTVALKEDSNANAGKVLTFKDWKTKKDSEIKYKTVKKQTNSRNASETCDRDHRKNNGGFIAYNQANVVYGSMPKNLNGMNNFGMRGNGFGILNNGYYNSFNIFGFNNFNNYARPKKFMNNNCNLPSNFNASPAYNCTNGRYIPNSFFSSDSIYHQRDLMQKPLPNVLKIVKSKQLQELDTTHSSSDKKEKGSGNKPNNNTQEITPTSDNKISTAKTMSLGEEPKVYVPNPNASKDGKAFIPKPKLPEENLQISKEEKKQQWKAYREAMKPFKNREFYNAKRVVQRLGKKDINELDEKELFRLTNAREVMAAHKARLTAKYSDYVKAENKSNELGEVYVLKKPPLKDWEVGKAKPKNYPNYSKFSETYRNSIIEPGRKILGGYSSFKGFVPGGMLEGTSQRMGQISAL